MRARAALGLRQDGHRRVRDGARPARLRARRERRHRDAARRRGDPRDPARGADGLRRDARPPRRDAAPGRARRHPRAPRRAGGRRRSRRPRHRRRSTSSASTSIPFEQTVGRLDVEWDEAIEKIDVGGPALLRGAAKNHAHVIPVCRPEDYEPVLAELRLAASHRRDAARARRTRLHRARRRTTAPSPAGSPRGLGFPETLVPVFDLAHGALVRREPASARGASTPSAARARTCSRASSSSTASRSRSTTSTTSPPPACSRSSSTGRPA